MANPCGGLTGSPYNNEVCSPGFIKGMFLYEDEPSAVTEANAILQATWDADALLDQPDRMYNIVFDNTEGVEPEIVEEEFTDGSLQITQTKEGASTYEIISSISAYRTIFAQFENGKTMYCYYYTDTNVLLGKEITAGTIQAVKIRMYTSYKPATGDTTEKIVIKIQDLENWRQNRTQLKPTAFQCREIATVQNFTLNDTDDTLTTLTVEAKNLDKVGITDLETTTPASGYFILTNTTTSSVVTITSITRSGYSYVLNFVAQTEADAWSLSYEEPSVSGELYDIWETITGTFTA
jgi:hypothetical protein